jgi:CHASE2 domain-containing sensor protein
MPQIVHAKFRPRPDIWLTISGWIWLAYAAALLVLATVAAA